MMIRLKKISLWILFVAPSFANAQPLATLITKAVAENLEIKVLEQEYMAALEKAPQVRQLPDPEVGIGVFPLPVETRLGGQTARLSATQMFPWFGTLDSQADLENAKARALYERIGAERLNIIYELKIAYYRLYEIQQSQVILQRNIILFEALERLALSKVESGKATAADVLRVQLKTEELKQELSILEIAKTNPSISINQLLNRSLETPITATDSLSFAALLFDKNTLATNIKANHPMLRMFELQQDISRQIMVTNELNGKASFGIGLDYIMVNERSDAAPTNNGRDILQLRGIVKIPLYRGKYEAKDREEQLKIVALTDKKVELLSRFMASIEKAYADFEIAQLKINLYEKQIAITEAAINILETKYSTEGNNFDELLRLEKELIDYDLKILKAIVQSHMVKSRVERFIIQ